VILLKRAVLDGIIAHARDEAPCECCGVMLGSTAEVIGIVRGHNVAEDRQREYLLDPADHFTAIRRARELRADVVGFYHSHPRSAAVPSPVDQERANYPNYLYGIVSLADDPPHLDLFRLVDGNFVQARFVTVA
jgi:proteasome lid subunit RPN8/RPN11